MLRVLTDLERNTGGRVRITAERRADGTVSLDFILADGLGGHMQGTRRFLLTTEFQSAADFEAELWCGELFEVVVPVEAPRSSLWWAAGVGLCASAISGLMAAAGLPLAAAPQTFAVMAVALVMGLRPALVATLLVSFGHNLLVVPPVYSLTLPEPGEWALMAFWVTTSLTTPWLDHHRAQVHRWLASVGTLFNPHSLKAF